MSKEKVMVVEKWEDWNDEVKAYKDFKRPDGTVIRFLCRGLSGRAIEEIDQQCKIPEPPKKPVMVSPGKPKLVNGMTSTAPDYNDPQYKKELEDIEKKRTVLILEKGLLKPDGSLLPGKTWQEKYGFLLDKIPGDVVKLKNFIWLALSNLHAEDVDFFPIG